MDDRKQALIALRDKVKAGDSGVVYLWHEALGEPSDYAAGAYHGSLDAAKALHEAVLPGWFWSINPRADDFVATVCRNEIRVASETDDDPARAWLLAILEALIALETDQ